MPRVVYQTTTYNLMNNNDEECEIYSSRPISICAPENNLDIETGIQTRCRRLLTRTRVIVLAVLAFFGIVMVSLLIGLRHTSNHNAALTNEPTPLSYTTVAPVL
ncbi:hypothetical protein NEDG_00070 [Nematocida displodere]|uniref:Uncharacterized protein n=1 Tax=Nematocida displodere TaxID=1805483 RepID=A0A177EHZ6_9MICR|nr:hypothetical protein NEDG_00070 [Nematocida displodere]